LKSNFKILLLSIFLINYGCEEPKWDITLYEQKIKGTSKAIYKYDAWGGRDSHKFGYTILDTTEKFKVSNISNLPIDKLYGIPNSNGFSAIERNWPEEEDSLSYEPIKSYKISRNEIEVSILKFQRQALREKAKGTGWFDFSTFKETEDSLEFYNLYDSKTVHHTRIDTLKVKKGNIIIRQNNDNKIIEIIIEDLILSNDKENQILSNKTYFLKPKETIKSDKFSDYGIFKTISTVPNSGSSQIPGN